MGFSYSPHSRSYSILFRPLVRKPKEEVTLEYLYPKGYTFFHIIPHQV